MCALFVKVFALFKVDLREEISDKAQTFCIMDPFPAHLKITIQYRYNTETKTYNAKRAKMNK